MAIPVFKLYIYSFALTIWNEWRNKKRAQFLLLSLMFVGLCSAQRSGRNSLNIIKWQKEWVKKKFRSNFYVPTFCSTLHLYVDRTKCLRHISKYIYSANDMLGVRTTIWMSESTEKNTKYLFIDISPVHKQN